MDGGKKQNRGKRLTEKNTRKKEEVNIRNFIEKFVQ